MQKLILTVFLMGILMANAQIKYPNTARENVVDDYHGTKVEDPYRWLEDDNSERTKDWVMRQNKLTFDYLDKIPFRKEVRKRLEEIWNYPREGAPFKKGDWYYIYKNDGLQNQFVLYRTKNLKETPEVFLNPNSLDANGLVSISGMSFSKSGKYVAYSISKAGSDWQEAYVMDVETKKLTGDSLKFLKFTSFSWNKDDGFYYNRYPAPAAGEALSGTNEYQKVYYHKLGNSQDADQLIYEDKKNPKRFHSASLTEDGRFLVLFISEGTSGSEIWAKDLKNAAQKDFSLVIKGFKTEASVVGNDGDRLLISTNQDAPNYKLVSVDIKKPGKENWKTIIAEKSEPIAGVSTGGGNLFATYLKNASTLVQQYQLNGTFIREISLPGIGSASGFYSEVGQKEFYYSFSSYNQPASVYHYDINSGTSTLFQASKFKMDVSDFVTEQIFITSKDGTQVPMFVTYKKGIQLNGNNPLLLYGYGGFNIALTPSFSVSNAFFVDQGGVYVVVNLRGGSEFGDKWHKAGMLDKKQNVFDDFIAAAQYLIKNKWTSADKLAISGGSNGGLLVGAVMTQRPELFKVALPAVGVLDMLRYHKFTIGLAWATEYGNADSVKQFPYLYKYSPYHNIRTGVKYPATLVTTGDHDDRVVPAHSFKFTARLQEYAADNELPLLIRIETNAGHGAGKPTSKIIDEAADVWSFTMFHLGMNFGNAASKKSGDEKPGDAGKGEGDAGTTGKGSGRSGVGAAGGKSGTQQPMSRQATEGAANTPAAQPQQSQTTTKEEYKKQQNKSAQKSSGN